MSKEFGSETLGSVAQQVQVTVSDRDAVTTYAALCRVRGSAEEFIVDLAGPLRPTGQTTAEMLVDHRVILSPFAAKRLAMAMAETVQRYEKAYGPIELDERRRRTDTPR